MQYLLDTNICIDILRNVDKVIEHLSKVSPEDCAVSTITSFELFSGVEECSQPAKEGRKVRILIDAVRELAFDHAAAMEAANIRAVLESAGTSIGPFDTLLAGQARSLGMTFVTSNTGELVRVDDLTLENWRE